jgi:protein-tyrosine-phosphatase
MAEAIFNHLAQLNDVCAVAQSAGTVEAGELNSAAVEAVAELGISMNGHVPKRLTLEMVTISDRIVSMGCGVDAKACPARFIITEDWNLDDPAGRPLEEVRVVRDQIVLRVRALLKEFQ